MYRTLDKTRANRGNALVEFGLISFVLASLWLGGFDGGMYMYAFISVQNAARSAVERNASGSESATDQGTACSVALDELRGLPSVPSSSECSAAPLRVTSVLCGGSGTCGTSQGSADGKPSTLVTVQYTMPSLFQLPFAGPAVITASSQMRLRSTE